MTQRNRVFIVLAYGFVLLGMSLTALGVTWPSVADDLDRSLAELGFVTLFFGGGYTLSTAVSGRLANRNTIGRLLLSAAVIAMAALVALTISLSWPLFLIAAGTLGLSGGLTDAATNTYVAIRRGAREMGFIHGAFGVGAIAGPLLVTGLLALGASWRIAWAALAVAEILYILGLWRFARRIAVPASTDRDRSVTGSLRSGTLGWSVTVFFLYAGIAGGAGIWAFTLLTEERGIAESAGGVAVAAYWGGFTASRFLLGFVGDRVDPDDVLRWSAIATAVGLAVFWWNPTPGVGVASLIFTGFAHGPVFPLEVLLTPRRFGAALTASVVGYEIAAANVGGAVLPGVVGFFVDLAGLEVVPPILFVNALLLWAAIEALRFTSRGDIRRIAAALEA
jgi:fucose permease